MVDATEDDSLRMEMCFITSKFWGRKSLKRGSALLARFLHCCQLSILQAGSLTVSGRPAPGPFCGPAQAPSMAEKSLLVFGFSLQLVSHQSLRMFKGDLFIAEILLPCCKLAFFFLATTRTNNPERMRKIIQLKTHHTSSEGLYYCSWSSLFWWSLTAKREKINPGQECEYALKNSALRLASFFFFS